MSPTPTFFSFSVEKFQLWETEAFYRKYNILKQFLAKGHLSLRLEFLGTGNRRETDPSQNLAAHRSGDTQADGEQQHMDLTTHTHIKKNKNEHGHLSPVPPIQPCYWNNWSCKLGNTEKSKGETQKSGGVLRIGTSDGDRPQPPESQSAIVTPVSNLICFLFACNSTLGPCFAGFNLLPI